jgi:prepilin-type N-terminal cleavage/methylation domain-containing protein
MKARLLLNRSPHAANAFTLIELMVSIAVLGLLGGMVMQLLASATRITSNSRRVGDCDTEARFALDQISADLSRRVRRPDVDAFVAKLKGDDRLYFFAETPGYSPNLSSQDRSTISLVGYRLQVPSEAGGRYLLQRYARALPWTSTATEAAMPFVVLTGTPPTKPLAATTLGGSTGTGSGGSFPKVLGQDKAEDIYYQTVGENIVRFEISLLRKPNLSNPARPVAARLLSDAEIPAELAQFGLSNIASLVVTIAVIDDQASLRISTGAINSLELQDTVPADFPLYPLDQWNKSLLAKINSLPKNLAGGLRFYQRVIPVQ